MAKVAHLTSVHPPLDIRILLKECATLKRHGLDVVLVAAHDRTETLHGISVRGVPRPKTRVRRVVHTGLAVFREGLRQKADLYHIHDPELLPFGFLLRILGKKVVYDVHEHVPNVILYRPYLAKALRGTVSRLAGTLEWAAARAFTGIVAATPSIGARFPPGKTVVIQNFPYRSELNSTDGLPFASRPPNVAYVGSISEVRGINEMVDALALLENGATSRLLLAGAFSPPSLEQTVGARPGWKFVDYFGWQGRDQIVLTLSRSRAGLVTLHPTPNHLDSQPTKLFEYMSAGLPVVASDFPYWRKFVEPHNAGLFVDPLDPKDIARAVRWIMKHPEKAEEMGRRGRKVVQDHYNWEAEGPKLLAFYEKVLRS